MRGALSSRRSTEALDDSKESAPDQVGRPGPLSKGYKKLSDEIPRQKHY